MNVNRKFKITALLLLLLCSCRTNEDRDIDKMLKSFYSAYLTQMEKPNVISYNTDSLKQYFTETYLKKIAAESEQCDCDPIVQSQDYSSDWAKTLTVSKMKNEGVPKYQISFEWDTVEHKSHFFYVFLKWDNNNWKINDVRSGN